MTERIVTLKSVSKQYPGVVAADAVSMDFFAGEIVGLVGKNGAGKSTIIRIMAGVERPDHGIIAIGKTILPYLTTGEAKSHGLSFVHQELHDVPMLTVAENILIGFGYPKTAGVLINRNEMCVAARAALAKIHMDIDPARKLASLSVAERRMVMIARALVNNTKMIVMDEPTASLTDGEINELHAALRKLKQDGVCVVYVSHRLQEVMALTDRVIVMRDGRVVGNADTDSIDQAQLIEMIVGTHIKPIFSDRRKLHRAISAKPRLRVENIDPFRTGNEFAIDVFQGGILGIAGLAGSGRTEAVRQIIGADYNPRVTHLLCGAKKDIRNPSDALTQKIALVPEDRRHEGALLGFSIANNISLSSLTNSRHHKRYPFPSKVLEGNLARRLFDRLSIKASTADQKVAELSGGNQQKVVLARCLAADVNVLILDEPTHGIDVGAKEEIYQLIEQLVDEGKSIILISSDLPELIRLADRAVVLREGQHVGELKGADITEHEILRMCFHSHLKVA